jgi:hypothetical protein
MSVIRRNPVNTFITCLSFEARSIRGIEEVGLGASSMIVVALLPEFEPSALSFDLPPRAKDGYSLVSRLSIVDQWTWVQRVTERLEGHVVVDVTCFTRELLGMLLYAISLKVDSISKLELLYTSARMYATQREPPEPLSLGVLAIRPLLGFPGEFETRHEKVLLALVGHEDQRLIELVDYIEPSKIYMAGELVGTSTGEGFRKISSEVETKVRERIGVFASEALPFNANDIHATFDSIASICERESEKNISIVAMNTKLSFAGAAFYGLSDRRVRLMYAVPREYNVTNYSVGFGETTAHDCTALIKRATTLARPGPT